uniref:Uncharacterized protein n=1 Tax=Heterorhabditis bacteriophora TaxID=37862 RepID=A0A1I7XDN7_HETBA
MEDDLEMSNQSQAARRNQKWRLTQSEAWLNDKILKRAERELLETEEESFWVDVIEKYLSPLTLDNKDQDRLQKDCLHIEWPIGPKFNHTVRPCHGDSKEFFAMLCHRFGTLAHIIASTELFCFRKTIDKLNEDELVVQNAVEIARELQAIRGVDETLEEPETEERAISRRRVVQNLESSRRSMMKRKTETLDAAFKKRSECGIIRIIINNRSLWEPNIYIIDRFPLFGQYEKCRR